ncbi:AQG_2a_G0057450.mRNA.1.CDS.1 [Saccharomyces cerevisiae]|uniref:Glycogen phosphorylase n=3 Tax=Saccharomyces cerevisiae TaxID=4932 RepID=PHSG_YEAST|nr:glycogen phosphorylase [Saccharomyces cerevisiae S288C]P06738.4 RecName: Full=Glycogen phosphorylase [Saccharomyces cerevisiae S288C]AAB68057.1 Gph1p: Glycogen phosphorylase (Swiss Prot. accession number P06738) [Saccharomyces cerevisiae]AJV92250.1 Gph1p [Saccharomyces cerevisiae YJM1477]AJV94800.1 Gph1p [Saccharomyces cerevisiae YJM1574]AJV96365.1 Gph1p [Saccharomyces cerevisiae YJM193]AJV98550.1 Gph1p [Saccharomyces cerevisiae YJM271]AJW13617.1 Gph1p [Saccharomyces cerevisiae YJM1242]A|eukprot:NP_015486.1 glycogen phosphorylase [Saccharomyces cerevisiae S288C]
MPPASTSTTNDMITEEPTSPHQIPRLTRRLTGFLPQEIKSIDTMIPLKSRALWNKHQVKKFNKAEDFQDRFIDHVETTLARSLYNCDDMAAYEAASMSIRDNLVIDWNKTQQKFTTRDPKRVYYLSLEFLMGRALDNALINMKIEDPEDPAASKGKPREMIKGALDDLGFKLEDVLDQEPDAGLGNGGLGRLAACFVDSMATEGIPAWGYGLRYEYGIFAQKIIDGYQVETPDYWLNSGNPWEIERNEVQIPVTFYGYVDRPEGGKTTLSASQWIGGERVLAVAYDFPVPGFKTSNVNNLRLWQARPTTEFDFAKFNNGDYKNSVAQQQRAESITAVLYPNDNFAQGKELRLKQQYFWCAASLHDILRRFKKSKRPWTEFPDQVAIQLNDTHPTLAIVELQRVLVDLEKLDWHEAWDIVTKTFAYTNHTVMQEALEKWPVGLFGHLLPRHLEIIYDINWFFLQDVAKKFPKDVDLLSRISIIEENSPERQIRMAFLAIVGSHKVNGVAELHSELIKTTIFKDFVKFYGPSKFVNVTNGITPRRWLKQANPSLAKLISETLNDPTEEYLLDMAKLTQLGKYVEDKEFLKKWNQVKLNNKIRLVDLIKKENDGVDIINREYLDDTLFDMQVKRIHEYKRQQLNVFGIIYRYLAMKNMLKNGASIEEVAKKYPRKVSIFGGKSAPGYYMAKLIIKLINCVADIVNNDESIEHLLKVVFVADYNVSKAEIIIPASDLSEHISTAGTEASGTSNMKFVMNGGLIIGTVDGANVEITREIGEDNVFLFGNLSENVEELRYNHQYHPQDLPSSLDSVLSYIESGQFSPENPNEFKPLVDSIKYHGDYYLVSDDFESYLATHELVDQEFHNQRSEWLKKSVLSVANVGFFSSDRCIEEYSDTIWNVEPVT